jgi:hypothetical protein
MSSHYREEKAQGSGQNHPSKNKNKNKGGQRKGGKKPPKSAKRAHHEHRENPKDRIKELEEKLQEKEAELKVILEPPERNGDTLPLQLFGKTGVVYAIYGAVEHSGIYHSAKTHQQGWEFVYVIDELRGFSDWLPIAPEGLIGIVHQSGLYILADNWEAGKLVDFRNSAYFDKLWSVARGYQYLYVSEKAVNKQYLINMIKAKVQPFVKEKIRLDLDIRSILEDPVYLKEIADMWNRAWWQIPIFSSIFYWLRHTIHGTIPFYMKAAWAFFGVLSVYIATLNLTLGCTAIVLWLLVGCIFHGKFSEPVPFKQANVLFLFRACAKEKLGTTPLMPGFKAVCTDDNDCPEAKVQVSGSIIDSCPVVIPHKCGHNMAAACEIRTGFERTWDHPELEAFSEFTRDFYATFLGELNLVDLDFEEWMQGRYGTSRKDELRQGKESGLEPRHFRSGIFVKDECYVGKLPSTFKPRKIETRQAALLAIMGPFVDAMTKAIKAKMSFETDFYYSAGATARQLGMWLERQAGFIYKFDVSNWDGSLTAYDIADEIWYMMFMVLCQTEFLPLIHEFYHYCYGVGKNCWYTCEWGRKSGDAVTSVFNSTKNTAFIRYVIGKIHPEYRISTMVMGDDSVIVTSGPLDLERIRELAARLGRKIDIEEADINTVEFCSGRFWSTLSGRVYGVKPFRQLAKFGVNLTGRNNKNMQRIMLGTALSQLPIGNHVPVYGAFLRQVIKVFGHLKPIYPRNHGDWSFTGGDIFECDDLTRSQFIFLYGWTLEDIDSVEHYISTLSISDFPLIWTGNLFKRGVEVDVGTTTDNCYYEAQITQVRPRDLLANMWHLLKMLLMVLFEEVLRRIPFGIGSGFTMLVGGLESLVYMTPINLMIHLFCHVVPFWFAVLIHFCYNLWVDDVNPASSIKLLSMTRKNNQRGKSQRAKPKRGRKKKGTSSIVKKVIGMGIKAASAGLGGYFGGPNGAAMASTAAEAFNEITGFGDYRINHNSIMDNQAPKFRGDNGSVRFKHSEFVMSVPSSTAFSKTVLPINPGLPETFPWLSAMAQGFETYVINGLVVMYKPTSGVVASDQGQGVVIIATHYDPSATDFANRREMEAYMYTTSCVPWEHMVHPVECDNRLKPLKEQYIRYGSVDEDLRWDDLGRISIAVQGTPDSDDEIGEIWVSYDITLMKPKILAHAVATARSAHISGTSPTNAVPLPTNSVISGSLPITITGDTVYFPPLMAIGYFFMALAWRGDATGSLTSSQTYTNISMGEPGEGGVTVISNSGTSVALISLRYFAVTGENASIKFNASTLPANGTYFDCWICQVDSAMVDGFLRSKEASTLLTNAEVLQMIEEKYDDQNGLRAMVDDLRSELVYLTKEVSRMYIPRIDDKR